jgi:O-antigen ligase
MVHPYAGGLLLCHLSVDRRRLPGSVPGQRCSTCVMCRFCFYTARVALLSSLPVCAFLGVVASQCARLVVWSFAELPAVVAVGCAFVHGTRSSGFGSAFHSWRAAIPLFGILASDIISGWQSRYPENLASSLVVVCGTMAVYLAASHFLAMKAWHLALWNTMALLAAVCAVFVIVEIRSCTSHAAAIGLLGLSNTKTVCNHSLGMPLGRAASILLLLFSFPASLSFSHKLAKDIRTLAYLSISATVVAGIGMTYSRGAYCGIIAFLVFGGVIAVRSNSLAAIAYTARLALVVGGAMLILWGTSSLRLVVDVAFFGDPPSRDRSIEGRYATWASAARMLRDNAVWGVGPGNFSIASVRYVRGADRPFVGGVFNDVLQCAAETGLVGVLTHSLFMAFVLHQFWIAIGSKAGGVETTLMVIWASAGLAAIAVRDITYTSVFGDAFVSSLVALLAACPTAALQIRAAAAHSR